MNWACYNAMKHMIEMPTDKADGMPSDATMDEALKRLTSDDKRIMMSFIKNIQNHLEGMTECQ